MIYGLVMAAGESKRFGDIKQLAKIDGVSMALRSYCILNKVLNGTSYLVLGANLDAFGTDFREVNVIHYRDWKFGLGSSIAHAVNEIKDKINCYGILITLGDQVKLNELDYQKLVGFFDSSKIVASDYGQRNGPPAIFPRKYFDELIRLKGDFGANEILKLHSNVVVSCEIDNALFDVDSRDDLKIFLNTRF